MDLEIIIPVVIGMIGIFREFIKIIQQFIQDDADDKNYLRKEIERRDEIINQLTKEVKKLRDKEVD